MSETFSDAGGAASPLADPTQRPSLRAWVRAQVDEVLRLNLFEMGAVITLLMVTLSLQETFWYIKLGVVVLSVIALVARPLVYNPLLWFGLVGVFALAFAKSWYGMNNHDFLKVYWCLAIGVSLMAADPTKALRTNARLLIGLCFLFAFFWKAVSADYVSGEFFNYFLLQDTRFDLFARHLGGLGSTDLMTGQVERRFYTLFGNPESAVALPLAPQVRWIASFMTWWTLAIEAAVAAAFLWPMGQGLSKWRDAILVAFILSTYFIAPILYFAWLLVAMAVVQCDRARFRYWPMVYVAVLALIVTRYHLPI